MKEYDEILSAISFFAVSNPTKYEWAMKEATESFDVAKIAYPETEDTFPFAYLSVSVALYRMAKIALSDSLGYLASVMEMDLSPVVDLLEKGDAEIGQMLMKIGHDELDQSETKGGNSMTDPGG